MSWLFALVVTVTPVRLVHVVQGVPVGVIELEQVDGQLHYRARHVFRDEARAFKTSWPVDAQGRDGDGLVSELHALSRRRAPGCLDVREERTGRRERLCLERDGRGTLDGAQVRVTWDAAGALSRVDVLDEGGALLSRFEASAVEPAPGHDPFGEGFPIEGRGPVVRLSPKAKAQVVTVQGVPAEDRSTATCLSAARAWTRTHPGAVVQLGLVLEEGRAWPHAWVRGADGVSLDPTTDDAGAAAREYLAFTGTTPGTLYLELAAGSRRVVRSER